MGDIEREHRLKPGQRVGPTPLPLHLAMVRAQYASAQALLAQAFQTPEDTPKIGTLNEDLTCALERWKHDYADATPAQIAKALKDFCETRLEAFLNGVERYQSATFTRPGLAYETALEIGNMRLLKIADACQDIAKPPILLVPSLVNPFWVLDLLPDVSFARTLAKQGFPVFIIDWGEPKDAEKNYCLADYCEKRIAPCLEMLAHTWGKTHVIGYCLGGNLALASALVKPHCVRSFTAIATPWNFAAMGAHARGLAAQTYHQIKPILKRTNLMPATALQALFAQLDPTQIERKFVRFSAMDTSDEDTLRAYEQFVAVEDWSNSGPDLAHGVVEDTFLGFYGRNTSFKGEWRVAGRPINPSALPCAALVIAAGTDKIVPPASTLALADQLPAPTVIQPKAGHVGMMVGGKAELSCWTPISRWLASH